MDAEAESLMEELKGIGSLAEASGSPLLASLNEAAQLGSRARTDLLARYEDASAEVRSPETAHEFVLGPCDFTLGRVD